MKVRSITTGINLSYPVKISKIIEAAQFNLKAKKYFENKGIKVQTVRITTQPWTVYCNGLTRKKIISLIREIGKIGVENGVDFMSIGSVHNSRYIGLIPEIICSTCRISTSVTIAERKQGINYDAIKKTARVIKKISKNTARGYGNFRFAAIANCPPNIPFFPASYHKGKPCFSIGLECSDLVAKAFTRAGSLEKAGHYLKLILTKEFRKIVRLAQSLEKREKILFKGLDISPAPSLVRNESLALAFEKLKLGKFGAPGTLAIAAFLTRVLKSIKVKKCGYSGLMLPVLEDRGLSCRWSREDINIGTVLACSSVCGTGLDCIPLPGDISAEKLYAILLDVAALSSQLNKPLSARLFPVPDKKAGDMTDFKSRYLMDCRITSVK